jgi:hypothetical protein
MTFMIMRSPLLKARLFVTFFICPSSVSSSSSYDIPTYFCCGRDWAAGDVGVLLTDIRTVGPSPLSKMDFAPFGPAANAEALKQYTATASTIKEYPKALLGMTYLQYAAFRVTSSSSLVLSSRATELELQTLR